jgi:hypothetical protein
MGTTAVFRGLGAQVPYPEALRLASWLPVACACCRARLRGLSVCAAAPHPHRTTASKIGMHMHQRPSPWPWPGAQAPRSEAYNKTRAPGISYLDGP